MTDTPAIYTLDRIAVEMDVSPRTVRRWFTRRTEAANDHP